MKTALRDCYAGPCCSACPCASNSCASSACGARAGTSAREQRRANKDGTKRSTGGNPPARCSARRAAQRPVAALASAGGADSKGLASEPKPKAGPGCACTAMERRCASSKSSARRSGLGRSPHVMASSRSCVQPADRTRGAFDEGPRCDHTRGRSVHDHHHVVRDPPSNAPSGQGVSPGPRSPSPRRGRSSAANPASSSTAPAPSAPPPSPPPARRSAPVLGSP